MLNASPVMQGKTVLNKFEDVFIGLQMNIQMIGRLKTVQSRLLTTLPLEDDSCSLEVEY